MSAQASFLQPAPQSLETLRSCPACSSRRMVVLHKAVTDRIFGVPGSWMMWNCCDCDVAFLNPRLTTDSIGNAYQNYYTHSPGSASPSRLDIRDYVIRSYAKRRLGAAPAPHLFWATWLLPRLAPGLAKHVEAQYRYLPRPRAGTTLLDVGCGNGAFLIKARALGWHAVGLEFDAKACDAAASRGLSVVQGSVPNTPFRDASFDYITLHHVIEHVHDPRAVLSELFRLLRPTGTLILTTPNWKSYGATFFGPFWRGLEPPRHLVLFTPNSLSALVASLGFEPAHIKVRPELAQSYFERSQAISNGLTSDSTALPAEIAEEMTRAIAAANCDPNRAEEFTLIATKPPASKPFPHAHLL